MTKPALDKSLEFMRVLWALDHALQERSKAMASLLGVTSPQRLALRLIDGQPGIFSKDLSELLHLDPSTLTGILKRLELQGLLQREVDPADKRRVRLNATAAGVRLLAEQEHTVETVVRSALASEKGKAVRKAVSLLQRLTETLHGAPAPGKKKKRATRRAP